MSNNTNAIGGHASSDSILPNTDQSCQEVAKPTQTTSSLHNPYQFSQDSTSELLPEHLQEWLDSGVDEKLTRLNVHSVKGAEFFELLRPKATATQSGTGIRQGDRKFLDKCLESVGWECNGRVKPTAGPLAIVEEYFCKKTQKRKKTPKYLQAEGVPLRATFLRVPEHIWQRVSEKRGVPMPKNLVIGRDGEAIGFWGWVLNNNIPVVFTEGEKKAGCLLTLGYAAISLPGINSGYRVTERDGFEKAVKRALAEDLVEFDTPGREITILFDYRAGDYSNSPEFKAATTTAKLFKSAIAKIAQLPGPDKGVDDFAVGGGDVEVVIGEASQQTSDDWQLKKWQRFRGFSPDIKINSKHFDAPAPESGKVTAIRSGYGTGKTYFVGEKVASDARGLQINLGYRNSLLLQQCEKWGSYHFDEHHGWQMLKDPDARLSLCVDSLLKLPIEMFEATVEHIRGMTVIFDESVSGIKHLILSRTLLGKRCETLERVELICKLADRVIALDGNQSDLVVDYLSQISGKPSVKIQNFYQGETPPVFFVDAGKKAKKWLSAEILKSPCPAIATDSLRDAEAFARQLTESHGPGILLTSKTAPTEDMKEFLKDLDAFIEQYKPAWIVYSPTGESGLDISIRNYFSDVFCWFVGVGGVDEFLQMSRRVRHPERIIVLCAERGLPSSNIGGVFETDILKTLAELSDTEARLLSEDESQLQKARENLAAQILTPHTILLAKLQAKAELERSHLREYLIKAFEAGGYSVQSVTADECDYDGHAIAKEECKDIEAQEIFNAPDIELAEALEIKLNFKATWDDRCRAIKFFLKARLPGIEDSGLWSWEFIRRVRFDERSLLSQLDADWTYNNPEDAEFLQRHRRSAGKREFLGDFSTRWLKIKALRALGLEKFLEPGKIWTQESSEVIELLELCKKKAITHLFGHPGKMRPIQWLNKLLNLIGCKLVGKNVKQNGVQHREYSYIAESSRPANWGDLVAFTAEKQAKKISEIKEAEALAVQEVEAVAPPPVFDTNLGGDATLQNIDAEAPIPQTPIANWTGWVQRWGKWCEARILGWCDAGTQYVVEYLEASGNIGKMFVFPEKFHPA